jgi:hypothetical protein
MMKFPWETSCALAAFVAGHGGSSARLIVVEVSIDGWSLNLMQLARLRGALWILFMTISVQAQSVPPGSSSKIIEKSLTFPSPVQWTTSGAEISLIHVAWGPADSPEMLSKGRQKMAQEQPAFYPDRPYVLALSFRAVDRFSPRNMYTSSGLVRVKDTDGNIEVPMVLTPDGFVRFSGSPGVYDLHFDKNTTTEYWDLFPAAADQKEFLFQVFLGNVGADSTRFSFRIVLRGADISIVDVSPQPGTTCLDLQNEFAGTVGASTHLTVHLVGNNGTLSGTEQYQRIGKTLWLRGTADTLGNFVLEERYPEDQTTGIFKGKFSDGCQVMQGYFSKPDGSRLMPFGLRQMHPVGTRQVPDQDGAPN